METDPYPYKVDYTLKFSLPVYNAQSEKEALLKGSLIISSKTVLEVIRNGSIEVTGITNTDPEALSQNQGPQKFGG